MSFILVPYEDLRFTKVEVKSLREDYVYMLIQNGHLTKSQFTEWVEYTRDEWLEFGINLGKGDK